MVCHSKSITKAASNLFITQQALSHSIRRLEEELGYKLFQRSVKGTQLTEAGLQFYELFSPIVFSYQNAVMQLKSMQTTGTLSLYVAPGTVRNITPELLLSFRKLHPGMKLDMINSSDKKIEHYIYEDKRRFALIGAQLWILEKMYTDYVALKVEPAYLLVHKDNPLSKMPHVSLSVLKNEHVLVYSNDSYYLEALNKAVEPFEFSVTPYFESPEIMVLLNMVNRGMGVLICRKQDYYEAMLNESVLIQINERTFDTYLAFVFQDFSELHPLAQEYIQFIQKVIEKDSGFLRPPLAT